MSRQAFIYGLIRDGRVVYVGRTVNLNARTSAHRSGGKNFQSAEVLETCAIHEAAAVETKWIASLNPCENKTRNGAGATARELPAFYADRISARIGPLANKLTAAAKKTGQKESEIVRVALGLFLTTHTTPEAIIAAVIKHRSVQVSA